jgi:Glycosyltransferase like family
VIYSSNQRENHSFEIGLKDFTMLENITFAVATNDRGLLQKNLLASPIFQAPHLHQILVQEKFASAAKAYNNAIEKSHNELIVFIHQDMLLPESWLTDLQKALTYLEVEDPQWGVLGCSGMTTNDGGRGYVYSSGLGILGEPFEKPIPVSTLDEIVLIIRKSSGLRFTDSLPSFHMYGADICMAAAKRGMRSYAISAFCIHNTVFNLVLPKDFYDCCRHMQRTWQEFLPIQTTCVRVTKFGLPMYKRRIKEFYLRNFRHKRIGADREADVGRLLETVQKQFHIEV